MGFIPKYRNNQVTSASQFTDINEPLRNRQAVGSVLDTAFNAGQRLQQIQKEKALKLDEHALVEKTLELQKEQSDRMRKLEGFYNENPNEDMSNLVDNFNEERQKFEEKSLEVFKTNEARQRYKQVAKKARYLDQENLYSWRAKKEAQNLQVKNNSIATDLSNLALENPTLDGAKSAIANLEQVRLSSIPALGENLANTQVNKLKSKVAYDYGVTALTNGQIGNVKQMLKDKDFKDALGVDGVNKLKSNVKRIEEQQKEKAQTVRKLKLEGKLWPYLDQVGETKNMELLDITRPETFIKRRAFIMDMEKKHGLNMEGIPVHPAEVENLKNIFIKANENDLTAILGNIDGNVPNDIKLEFGKQLFPKEPALAAAINISGEDPQSALSILKGFKRIRSKSLEINNKAFETAIDDELKAFIDDNDSRNLMKEAIKAHVVEKAFNQGKSLKEDVADIDLVEESVNEILGPKIEGFGGVFGIGRGFSAVQGGVRGFRKVDGAFINQSEFRDLFNKLNQNNIKKYLREKPVNFDGEIIDLNEFQDQISLETVGDGIYRVFERDTAAPLMNQSGGEFFLNLKEFYTNLEDN